jgi:TRAP-type transport system small permease protein
MKPSANPPQSVLVRGTPPLLIRAMAATVDLAVIAIGALMIVLVFFNVLSHAFGKDLAWVTELGELLMVWVTFLGGVAAAHRGAHMSINEFLDKLNVNMRRWADVAIQLLCIGVLLLLLFYGWKIFISGWSSTLTTLEWPMAWQYMPLPLSAALMLCFQGWDLLQTLRGVPPELRFPEDETV